MPEIVKQRTISAKGIQRLKEQGGRAVPRPREPVAEPVPQPPDQMASLLAQTSERLEQVSQALADSQKTNAAMMLRMQMMEQPPSTGAKKSTAQVFTKKVEGLDYERIDRVEITYEYE